jgi:hypothetical protein
LNIRFDIFVALQRSLTSTRSVASFRRQGATAATLEVLQEIDKKAL